MTLWLNWLEMFFQFEDRKSPQHTDENVTLKGMLILLEIGLLHNWFALSSESFGVLLMCKTNEAF